MLSAACSLEISARLTMCAILTENPTIIELKLQTELVRLSVIKHTATEHAAFLLQSGRMLSSEALSSSDRTAIRNFWWSHRLTFEWNLVRVIPASLSCERFFRSYHEILDCKKKRTVSGYYWPSEKAGLWLAEPDHVITFGTKRYIVLFHADLFLVFHT